MVTKTDEHVVGQPKRPKHSNAYAALANGGQLYRFRLPCRTCTRMGNIHTAHELNPGTRVTTDR